MENNLNEDKMVEIEVDFEELKKDQVEESWLVMFGTAIKMLLQRMFGSDMHFPVSIKGNPSEIKSFAKTLAGEKRYIQAYKEYGLNNPITHRNKAQLEVAVKQFERKTGIRWPFK